jgi:hypothetical protein
VGSKLHSASAIGDCVILEILHIPGMDLYVLKGNKEIFFSKAH